VAVVGVGDEAPGFALPGVADGAIETYSLCGALADGPVVLACYVFGFHPACVREWCAIRDAD
jgi:peroxiredoxin